MESSGQEETSLGIIFLCKYDHVIANTHRASENKEYHSCYKSHNTFIVSLYLMSTNGSTKAESLKLAKYEHSFFDRHHCK